MRQLENSLGFPTSPFPLLSFGISPVPPYLSAITATWYSYIFLNETSTHFSNNVASRGKETEWEKASRSFFLVATVQIDESIEWQHTEQSIKAPPFSFLAKDSSFFVYAFCALIDFISRVPHVCCAASETVEDLSINCFLRGILSRCDEILFFFQHIGFNMLRYWIYPLNLTKYVFALEIIVLQPCRFIAKYTLPDFLLLSILIIGVIIH